MKKEKIAYIVCGLMLVLVCGCGKSSDASNLQSTKEAKQTSNVTLVPTISPTLEPTTTPIPLQEIKITSESLTEEGMWLTAITGKGANPKGLNQTPQLSWNTVEGASCYAIYMYDASARYWLHWKAGNITTTSIDMGAELEMSKYFGPYPPSGTHEYQVIVYALKEPVEKCPGTMDSPAIDIRTNEENLDEINGSTGNIIGKGILSGKVTIGLKVE